MSKRKIEKAIREGKLISWDKIFASYPKERQERILARARYLRAATELRKVRKQMGISQQKLARKMDVKREYIARIESGQQNVTLDTLYRIAEATGKKFHFSFK